MISFQGMSPEMMESMCTPMHQIIPSPASPSLSSNARPGTSLQSSSSSHSLATRGALFIGSISAVHDADLLRSRRITHIVQVLDAPWAPDGSHQKQGADRIDYYKIQILDHSGVDLAPHLEAVCEHIDRALKAGGNVLVHCQQVRTLFFSFYAYV